MRGRKSGQAKASEVSPELSFAGPANNASEDDHFSRADRPVQRQFGGRFSMKACTPSSADASIMLQAIVRPASA